MNIVIPAKARIYLLATEYLPHYLTARRGAPVHHNHHQTGTIIHFKYNIFFVTDLSPTLARMRYTPDDSDSSGCHVNALIRLFEPPSPGGRRTCPPSPFGRGTEGEGAFRYPQWLSRAEGRSNLDSFFLSLRAVGEAISISEREIASSFHSSQ